MVLMAVTEILAMVAMAHVLAPGTAIATPLMFTLDMRTGRSLCLAWSRYNGWHGH
jgi:hypothetical protein